MYSDPTFYFCFSERFTDTAPERSHGLRLDIQVFSAAIFSNTIHGFLNGESVPVVTCLLPNKNTETYDFVFRFLRNKLNQEFGTIGALDGGYFHFDFECASKNSCKRIFPEVTVLGCLFHYCKAIQTNIQNKGLQKVYEKAAPYDTAQFASLYTWVRRLHALPLLAPDLVRPAWDTFLSTLPVTGDGRVDASIQNFGDYFQRTWLSSQAKIDYANHFSHDGPRTTNNAEGYHNFFHRYVDTLKPSIGSFLNSLQEINNHGHENSSVAQPRRSTQAS